MRRKRFQNTKGFIYKDYPRSSLLDGSYEIADRIAQINRFDPQKHTALVHTKISKAEDAYRYRQTRLNKIPTPTLSRDHFLPLIDSLNYFESIHFVHGDLNRKNIIFTENGFKIIDYEPSLLQMKFEQRQFMVTPPYISTLDLKAERITIRTDKLAFYYFVLRSNGVFSSKQVVQLAKTLNHRQFTGMTEGDFTELPYIELLQQAYEAIDGPETSRYSHHT